MWIRYQNVTDIIIKAFNDKVKNVILKIISCWEVEERESESGKTLCTWDAMIELESTHQQLGK